MYESQKRIKTDVACLSSLKNIKRRGLSYEQESSLGRQRVILLKKEEKESVPEEKT